MAANTELIGLDGLLDQFKRLSANMTEKTARRMVATAGGVLRKEAKAIAQAKGLNRSGSMIRNISIKRERNAPEGTEQYHLGVRHGRNLGKRNTKYLAFSKKKGRVIIKRRDDPFYWRFIEFGHKVVSRESGVLGSTDVFHNRLSKYWKLRTVKRTLSNDSITIRRRSPLGFVEPVPFLRPALENKRNEAIEAMKKRLEDDLRKAGR